MTCTLLLKALDVVEADLNLPCLQVAAIVGTWRFLVWMTINLTWQG
jgi:hypothetical protein